MYRHDALGEQSFRRRHEVVSPVFVSPRRKLVFDPFVRRVEEDPGRFPLGITEDDTPRDLFRYVESVE